MSLSRVTSVSVRGVMAVRPVSECVWWQEAKGEITKYKSKYQKSFKTPNTEVVFLCSELGKLNNKLFTHIGKNFVLGSKASVSVILVSSVKQICAFNFNNFIKIHFFSQKVVLSLFFMPPFLADNVVNVSLCDTVIYVSSWKVK